VPEAATNLALPRARFHENVAAAYSAVEAAHRGGLRLALSFAGQARGWVDDLARLSAGGGAPAALISAGVAALHDELGRGVEDYGQHSAGASVFDWRRDPAARPAAATLAAGPLSQPHIFLTLMATLAALESLAPAPAREVAPAATGLKPGDRVRLLRLGHIGEVVTVTDGTLTVRSGALTVRVRPDEVTPVQAPKAARAAPTRPLPAPRAPRRTPLADAVRLPEITLDLRGQRVEDALEATAQFLADATAAHREFVFVLHGHGTGAMKEALRRWLPQQRSIADWAPASGEQGGDAYTVVGLR
jgi:DNA mismatch repair protein MutS2